jgi:hypothetical protein
MYRRHAPANWLRHVKTSWHEVPMKALLLPARALEVLKVVTVLTPKRLTLLMLMQAPKRVELGARMLQKLSLCDLVRMARPVQLRHAEASLHQPVDSVRR